MRRLLPGLALLGVALLAAGCGTGGIAKGKADTSHGKQLFVEKCGSCHTLADAGTQGKIGPNLDDAFAGPRAQGFKESSIRNIVHGQILFAVQDPSGFITGPDGKEQPAPGMPRKLVTGQDAQDVAAYVASVAGVSAAGAVTTTTSAATTSAATTTSPAPSPTPAPKPSGGGGTAGGAQVAAGKQVFQSAGCTSCHTLKDAGATGMVGPNLDQKKPPKALVVDRVTNGKGAMPSFKSQLSADQIQAVAAYVSQVAGK